MARAKLMELLSEVLGESGREKLLAARGGREVYIPEPGRLAPDHWLVKTLGPEGGLLMCGRFQRERLSLPLSPAARKNRELHQKVIAMSLSGAGAGQISAATGLHTRSVHRLRAKYLH